METTMDTWVRLGWIPAIFILGGIGWVLSKVFKPKHAPGEMPPARAKMDTLSDPELQQDGMPPSTTVAAELDAVGRPGDRRERKALASANRALTRSKRETRREQRAEPETAWEEPAASDADLCRVCAEPLQSDGLDLEALDRVDLFWERLASLGSWFRWALRLVGAVHRDRGREFCERHGMCPPCARVAEPINDAHKSTAKATRAAEDRQWERAGLVDAVKDATAEARKRYESGRMKTRVLEGEAKS